MKKLLAILLSVLLLTACVPLGAVSVSAATSGTTGDCTWTLDGTHLTISGEGGMEDYNVLEGKEAPWGINIISVTIEDGVTTIGERAFCGCTSLTSATIPDSVATIGPYAFCGCTSLESVTISDSVTTIERFAFSNCTSLESVTIPDSVATIREDAFCGCTSLESVTLSDSVTTIGPSAFTNTAYYHNEENWENDVLYIGHHLIEAKTTISGAYAIKPGTLTIGELAFSNCNFLISVTIGDSVTTIGYRAFSECTSLESATIGDSVTTVGERAFYMCAALTSVTVGNSVTAIGERTFYWCTSLESVTIGVGVTTIESLAFYNCDSLTDVYYAGSEEDRAAITIDGNNDSLLNATWHYNYTPEGTVSIPEDAVCYNGHYYKVYDFGGDWQEAKAFCKSVGGHLATLTTAEEDQFVYSYLLSLGMDSAYFGLSRVGSVWKWCTGEPTTYLNWADGEPNNEDGDEFYGMYYFMFDDGSWNDGANHDVTSAFICEWDPSEPDVPVTPTATLGDLNGDGRINNRDLGLLQQHLAGWDVTLDLAATLGDLNGDSRINNRDLGLLQQYLAGWDVTLG